MLIDTHCHLGFDQFTFDFEKILTEIEPDFFRIIESTINFNNTLQAISRLEQFNKVRFTIGFHPYYAEDFSEAILDRYKSIIQNNQRVIGIGEIGLDYKSSVPLDKQKEVFTRFLNLAQEVKLPVTLHNRGFEDEIFTQVKSRKLDAVIFHCFSQDAEFLRKITDHGFYASFSGNITFKNADKLRKAVKIAPLDLILTETDSPFLAPQSIRGKRNTPASIKEIVATIAKIKEVDIQTIESSVLKNAKTAFKGL